MSPKIPWERPLPGSGDPFPIVNGQGWIAGRTQQNQTNKKNLCEPDSNHELPSK
jgi:hypothetical protein